MCQQHVAEAAQPVLSYWSQEKDGAKERATNIEEHSRWDTGKEM